MFNQEIKDYPNLLKESHMARHIALGRSVGEYIKPGTEYKSYNKVRFRVLKVVNFAIGMYGHKGANIMKHPRNITELRLLKDDCLEVINRLEEKRRELEG